MGVCDVHWSRSTRVLIRRAVLVVILLILSAWPVHAAMNELNDETLSGITGEGFSSFTLVNGITKAYFNITASTFTEIDSFKMGYYNDGTTLGWDENWEGVSLGSPTEDLVCNGLYIEAGFSNISTPATRTLDYIRAGTPSMTGPISADFISFSGRIEDGTGVALIDGHRLNLGQKTIYSNNDEFYLQLSRTGAVAGWWAFWKNALVTP
jgi:hypothetical protein